MEQIEITDIPFLRAREVTSTRMKKLSKWVKKYRKHNAYVIVTELPNNKYDVDMYCDKIRS
jgi:hypothetical protein